MSLFTFQPSTTQIPDEPKNVNCIESYVPEGSQIGKGEIFGMIKIGSQVDTILPKRPGMRIKVRPGNKVRAGESILVEW